jgi:DNA-binding response OmpR family regulator
MARILLVEDSERLQRSLKAGLEDLHYRVDQAFDGRQALDLLETEVYEVIILDLMLPQVSGLEVLKELRCRGNLSQVLILSAMDQTEDRIKGLDMGADDYLVKPFDFDELVSRIRALGRRNGWSKNPVIKLEELTIDTIDRRVYCGNSELDLSPAQYSLLLCLARYRGRTFSQEQLIARLYEGDSGVTRNTVEAHVSGLRRKLAGAGCSELLKTRRGFGYLIE